MSPVSAMAATPTSTVLALSWVMVTAALGWLGMLTVFPYAGVGFAFLLAAVIVVPSLILWTAARAGERGGLALLVIAFLVVLLSDVSLRGRAAGDTGLDSQSLLKFGLWISGWLLIFWRQAELRRAVQIRSGGAALLFALWCLATTAYSPTPAYTLGASAGMLGMWMIAAQLTRRSSRQGLLLAFAVALALGCLVSLALYVGLRDRAMALTEGGTVLRLAGIFGAPNTLGRAAGLLLLVLVLVAYYVRRSLAVPLIVVGGLAAAACLYLSESRASTLAFACAAVVVILRRRPFLLVTTAAVVVSITVVIVAFPNILQDAMLLVSRTGRLSEVTTFTGRTYIWQWVISAASDRPLLGYGFASTRVVIAEGYRGPWGFTTASAHNAWLQAWITVGFVGLVFLLANHVALILNFFRRPDRMRDGLFLYVVLLGLFEASFAGPSINLMTFTWLVASLLPLAGESGPRTALVGHGPRRATAPA